MAIRNIRYIDAYVCILSLQTAMCASFGVPKETIIFMNGIAVTTV